MAIAQVFAYDAYGNAIGFSTGEALTEFLYSGEQFDPKIGQQYLRARYYDPTTGRFNRLDPFLGNNFDPQSFHNYLYTCGNPINYTDPTGTIPLPIFMLLGAIIGTGVGGGIGYALGGWQGALPGAFGGLFMGLGLGISIGSYSLGIVLSAAAERLISTSVAGGFVLTAGGWIWGNSSMSWGIRNVGSNPAITQKRIAIVYGNLGQMMNLAFAGNAVSLPQFRNSANRAGHHADIYHNPDESKFVEICNSGNYDAVLVVAHGAGLLRVGEYYDSQGNAFTGFNLGGNSLQQNETQLRFGEPNSSEIVALGANWITANELNGKITNSKLIIFAASCRGLKNQSMKDAVGPAQYYGFSRDINVADVLVMMNGLVRYLNGETDLQLNNID
jgi:RHS repeat-associated protein